MRIGIVGAGITGLALAHLLGDKHDVHVFESKSEFGGIAKVENVSGYPYHLVGGHCFNSKNTEVKSFVFSVLEEVHWNKIDRKADIHMLGGRIKYPIEYAIKELYYLDAKIAIKCVEDFLKAPGLEYAKNTNLEDWFRIVFGSTLAETYFIPYNKKIWGIDPSKMSSSWVEGKLPIPDRDKFIKGLFEEVVDNMVHSNFYYPKNVFEDNLLKRLAAGKNIKTNYTVKRIGKVDSGFQINDLAPYDQVIVTAPLDIAIGFFEGAPDDILKTSKLLKYNQISNVIWETTGSDSTWTYFPESTTIFHRHIHIGNFIKPNQNITITEALGEVSFDRMIAEGKKFKYLKTPLAHHVSKHAYVLQDDNKESAASAVKKFIENQGVFLCGRFAEWEYYNMDLCIGRAIEVSKKINSIAL